LWWGISTSFERVDEGFPPLAQAEAILPVHVVQMQFDLSGLSLSSGPCFWIWWIRFWCLGVGYNGPGPFIWMLLHPSFTGQPAQYKLDHICRVCSIVLHGLKEANILPRWEAHRLYVVFGQHLADAIESRTDKGKNGYQGGLLQGAG
jgi:hypothetical protein